MALRINLYHEVLRTKKHAQYDPLKISIFGMVVIAIGLISWYFIEYGKRESAESAYKALLNQREQLKPQVKIAEEKEAEYNKQIALSEKLVRRIEERFYWGPVLEDIASVTPDTIQLTKLTSEVTGENLRKISITMEGIAAGDEPRTTAEEYRTMLAEKFKKFKNPIATFKSLEDGTDTVTLDGKTLRTAMFSINVTFNSGTEPPPPPPVRKPKTARTTVAQQNP